jgi:hypothetical protein
MVTYFPYAEPYDPYDFNLELAYWLILLVAVTASFVDTAVIIYSACSAKSFRFVAAIDPIFSSNTGKSSVVGMLFGRRRSADERNTLLNHALGRVFFEHTIFRKYP